MHSLGYTEHRVQARAPLPVGTRIHVNKREAAPQERKKDLGDDTVGNVLL